MSMYKQRTIKLRDIISEISNEINDIDVEKFLRELNSIINMDMSHSLIFQWWINNENTINIIY